MEKTLTLQLQVFLMPLLIIEASAFLLLKWNNVFVLLWLKTMIKICFNVKFHQWTFSFSLGSSSPNDAPIHCIREKDFISFLFPYLCIFSRNIDAHIRWLINIAKTTKTSKIKSLATIVNSFQQASKVQNFVIIINSKLHPL